MQRTPRCGYVLTANGVGVDWVRAVDHDINPGAESRSQLLTLL
jgi:hypothetical protein